MAEPVSEVMRVTKAHPGMPMAVMVRVSVVVVVVAVIVTAVVAPLVTSLEVMTAMFTDFVKVAMETGRSSPAVDNFSVMVPQTNRPGGFPPVVFPMVGPQRSESHRNESGGKKQ